MFNNGSGYSGKLWPGKAMARLAKLSVECGPNYAEKGAVKFYLLRMWSVPTLVYFVI